MSGATRPESLLIGVNHGLRDGNMAAGHERLAYVLLNVQLHNWTGPLYLVVL